MSEKTRAELKEQIKIMNHNYQVIREMHERSYQYSVGEIKRLQDELERTRKALEIAVDGIKYMRNNCLEYAADYMDKADEILEQITALEQKD